MRARWLIFFAYLCSGFAGLVYQVTWTRLLVLHVGSTTAAITTVVAAFMGGLALGAAAGARAATRLSAARAATIYAALEGVAAASAILLPLVLAAFVPILAWAYGNDGAGTAFTVFRTTTCVLAVTLPALLLGATYPMAIRAISSDATANTHAGRLYALNTTGAACGSIAAGFWLLPAIGLRQTVFVGAGASIVAGIAAAVAARLLPNDSAVPDLTRDAPRQSRGTEIEPAFDRGDMWGAACIVAATGFVGLLYEVAWTRAAASLLGPTTYAFAGIVFTLIAGLAVGSAIGATTLLRRMNPYLVIGAVLGGTALAAWWGNIALGTRIPENLAHAFAAAGDLGWPLLTRMALTVAPLVPVAIGLGISFPSALQLAGTRDAHRRISLLYAINTGAGVVGTFLAAPLLVALGLEGTLRIVPAAIMTAAAIALALYSRFKQLLPTLGAFGMLALAVSASVAPLTWDRELLASGIYKYAKTIPADVDLDAVLKAATLVDYHDGEHATVAVTSFAGTTSLVVDGKVDGSNGGDMLTQELVAHLPLLLHEHPRDVLVIGLGTGVTLAAAATHPAERIDNVEISPEIVRASAHFSEQNRNVLADPRVHLIVGDGRSQLRLGRRMYDVIISEPSNPWVAGMAALFTRETFDAIRTRLAPGGIVSQWLHTYDISEPDLRSIVATFASVFPNSTLWMVGDGDLLLVASSAPLDNRLGNIARAWPRPGVAADLARVGVMEPFHILSMWAGGPREVATLGTGAALQSDDRMALEFSGPSAVYRSMGSNQVLMMRHIRDHADVPATIANARAAATAKSWRGMGAMLEKIHVFDEAYEAYTRAFDMDPSDDATVSGFAVASIEAGKTTEAIDKLTARVKTAPASNTARVALSKLLSSSGQHDAAIAAAQIPGDDDAAFVPLLEQLAALYADGGDIAGLERTVERLQAIRPNASRTHYLSATVRFMQGAYPDALSEARRAIAADPNDGDALNLEGDTLANMGKFDEAQKAFEAALVRLPADATVFANLGQVALAKGETARAEKRFAAAITLSPSMGAAREGLRRAQAMRSGN
jgi:spermidine synthase